MANILETVVFADGETKTKQQIHNRRQVLKQRQTLMLHNRLIL